MQRNGKIVTCNAFYRKDVFKKVGLFEQSLVSGGDHDFSLRAQKETDYTLQYAPDAIVYHQHRSSLVQFWKQYYKYGLGRIYLAQHHKKDEFREENSIRVCQTNILVSENVSCRNKRNPQAWTMPLKIPDNKEKLQKLQDNFLLSVSKLAYFCGLSVSSYKNKIPYFDTIFY